MQLAVLVVLALMPSKHVLHTSCRSVLALLTKQANTSTACLMLAVQSSTIIVVHWQRDTRHSVTG